MSGSKNRAKAAEYRHRPDVELRRKINQSLPTERNAIRKTKAHIRANLKKGYT